MRTQGGTDVWQTLRIEGNPQFALTTRNWTTEHLDRALHTADLKAGRNVWVDIDYRHHGLGSASCGEGVLPQYKLLPRETEFSFDMILA